MLVIALLLVPVFAALVAWTVEELAQVVAGLVRKFSPGTRRGRSSAVPLH